LRLRTYFAILVAVTLVPLLALAVAVVLLAMRDRHTSIEHGLQERAVTLAVAVDRELESSITALRTLAASTALDERNYPVFYEEARRAREVSAGWLTVYLVEPSGHQIMTLLRPLGTPLPNVGHMEFVRAVGETARPYVSDLTFGPVSQRHIITVDVPVLRDGNVRYILGASMVTDALADLLRRQVPDNMVAAVRDRKDALVARSRDHQRHVGGPPRAERVELLSHVRQGGRPVFEVENLDGVRVFMAMSRVPTSDFVAAVSVPVASVASAPQKLWWALAIGGAVILAGALAAASMLARRVGRPIHGLARAAAELASGEPVSPIPATSVREVAAVREAMLWAAHEVSERAAERERRMAAEAGHAAAEERSAALEQMAREKDEFLAMLAHELRNPLGAVASANAVLSRIGGGDHAAARARAIIARQVEHLSGVIDDLLDISRLTVGKIVLTRRPCDLAAIVRRALETFEANGATSRHRVTLAAESAWVNGDETRLEQIFNNLLTNAFKFTPDGGRVEISVAREDDGGAAVLRIRDSGVGISTDRLPRVFDLFFQGEATLSRSQGGLGIGLTLVKRLAELHEGSVSVASDGPSRGSVFTVRLPGIPALPATLGASSDAGDDALLRVLLIEDNADSREMLKAALEMSGHTVYGASDGRQGIEAANRWGADVAVVDIGLPGMDGYEVGKRLRALPGGDKLFLVALTGYGQPADRQRSEEAGFDVHLVKPIDPGRLEQVLTRDD
jgi:signal transduction histidine kinase/CheY-like chemotaxis protein